MSGRQMILAWAAAILEWYGHLELANQVRAVRLPLVEGGGFYLGSWDLNQPFCLHVSRIFRFFNPDDAEQRAALTKGSCVNKVIVFTIPLNVTHFSAQLPRFLTEKDAETRQ